MELELVLVSDRSKSTLQDWCARDSRPSVIDFWNTRCTQCPAALRKLDLLASERTDIFFGACSLAVNVQATVEDVEELLGDEYPNLHHAFMTFEMKEELKAALEFASLPFCLVCIDGRIAWKGDPRSADLLHAIKTR